MSEATLGVGSEDKMQQRSLTSRGVVSLITALCLALSPAAPLAAQEPAAQPASVQGTEPRPEVDGGWPRAYETDRGGHITLYQPQLASWEEQRDLVAYSAVAYEAPGATKATLGSIKILAQTRVSTAERLVSFSDMRIAEAHFADLEKDQVGDVTAELTRAMPEEERVIGLDRALASVDRSQILPKNNRGVRADPPPIFFSTTPARLVNIDGDPIWSPIEGNDLKFAVNTNWDLFQHEPSGTLYLRDEDTWLKARDLDDLWEPAGKLPSSFEKLPDDDNWKAVKEAVPGEKIEKGQVPWIFVSTKPAELILVDGWPLYEPVAATSLTWVSNTESDVFRVGGTGNVYFLVSGRWFTARDFTGPWTFATPELPEDFRKIPLEHPRSRVLASVPGTREAAEAVLLAQVPQTARVNRNEIQAPEVAYQGEPKYVPVEQTTVERAVNTDKDILKVGDLYYMCFQGVWFMSKSPTGPWEVTSEVPKEIYEIPVSSPAHHVTYVTVEEDDDDDDEWVQFATVAAFTGIMIAWGCAVWGTGYYYPPYWGWGARYPYYYPRFPSYGFGGWYNPWTGGYGRRAVAYGPYGGAGIGARYNPRTGTYARGAAAWGPYGAAGRGQAWNPRTGTYARTRQGSNVYGSWGGTAVQRGDQWAVTGRATDRATGTTTRGTRTSGGGAAVTRRGPSGSGGAVRTGSGDLYAGRDGNVYRRTDSGWEQHQGGGSWQSTSRGAGQRTTVDQLNRDYSSRAEGAQRTRDYSSYRSSGGRSWGGSYRSRGGFRGGGRRR
jgi:hypothetical protein